MRADDRGYYARSKLAADQVASRAMGAGAPLTIVRPGLLFGPGRMPPLARRVVTLGPLRVVLASPNYLLPLAYVDNVADAIVAAARSPVADGRAYTIVDVHARQADYARLYREIGAQRWLPVYAPRPVLRLAASGAERLARALGRRAPITRHQVDRTLRSATFITQRAHDELGWYPRVPLDEALRRTFAAQGGPPAHGAPAAAHSAA
jgi:nucleoside-diphosphate-sugar epimerase